MKKQIPISDAGLIVSIWWKREMGWVFERKIHYLAHASLPLLGLENNQLLTLTSDNKKTELQLTVTKSAR